MSTLERFGEAARSDRLSFWMASADGPVYGSLSGTVVTDVAIVGAGIVGLTAALLLAESGREVVVVEADRVAAGVSGFTTAKVTAGHGFIYSHLESTGPGCRTGVCRGSARRTRVHRRGLCSRHATRCDLESRTNYVVIESEDEIEALEAELAAAERAGLAARPIGDTSVVPFPVAGGLMLEGQAQFHVRKYLLALADLAVDGGVHIYDRSPVTEITGNGPYAIKRCGGGQGECGCRRDALPDRRARLFRDAHSSPPLICRGRYLL